MVDRDHCFRTYRPSAGGRLPFTKQFQVRTIFATGETVGLAEWIIVVGCLVVLFFLKTVEIDMCLTISWIADI